MILHILETIYTLPFFSGAIAGSILWKLYCHSKARYLDRREPLPDGARHSVARMSRQWIAGLVMAATIGYVLLSTGKTEERTQQLNADVTRCWQETYLQIRAQVVINSQNDAVTRQQQALQREYDEDTSNWLKDLVNPPGDLGSQPTNSPDRQAYGIKRSIQYQDQLDDLGTRFDHLVAQRADLDRQRALHPLPEARCGATSGVAK